MDRIAVRRSHIGLAFALTLLSALTACRNAEKSEPAPAAVVAPPASAPAPVAPATVAPANDPATPTAALEEEELAAGDAGADAGPRKRRRVLAARGDAGVVADALVAAPPAPAAEPAPEGPRRKHPTAAMDNEAPYGNAAASVGPALKNAPLPSDDPWTAPGASPR
jgi:hypothetical protein